MPKVRIVSNSAKPFINRQEAGQLLSEELKHLSGKKVVVLGIPRGGIIVAAEIARLLNAELDIALSRKIGSPGNPELAIGAVSEDGETFLNESLVFQTGSSKAYIQKEKARQLAEIKNRSRLFRQIKARVSLRGKIVIITDDGIATGATMIVALLAIRQEKPAKLIVAVPVGAEEAVRLLADYADEVIALRVPEFLGAIGQFYTHFEQASDEEVLKVLKEAAKNEENLK